MDRRQHFKDGNLSKLIYRFNTMSVIIPGNFRVEIDKPILKFTWKC